MAEMGRRKRRFSTAVEKALRRLRQIQAEGAVDVERDPEDDWIDDEVNFDKVDGPSPQAATTRARGNRGKSATGADVPAKNVLASASAPAELANEWREHFSDLRERFPYHLRTMMSLRASGFRITGCYADGTVIGTYTDQTDVYNVYVSLQEPPIGCSCRQSNGKYICEHTWGFLEKVVAELRRANEFTQRINARQFSEDQFDPNLFQFDETNDRLNRLATFLEFKPEEIDVALPPVETVPRTRIGWHLRLLPTVSLALTVQELGKRGDRWKKGNAVAPSSLDSSVEQSAADRAALRVLKGKNSWHSTSESRVAEALLCLIGQPNVSVNSEEYEVRAGDATLKLVESNGAWRIELFEASDATAKLQTAFCQDGVLSIDEGRQRVYVTWLSNPQTHCMMALTKIPPVRDPRHVQLLTERCQQLQGLANIVLPQTFGQVLDQAVSPVFLLRCRPEGFVEYGIRVRDAQGKLHLPGDGIMITSTIVDGQPVQHRRSFAAERSLFRKLQTEFDLTPDTANGHLSFERGLQLIAQLEQRSSEIEVLWDKQSEAPLRSLGTLTNKNVRVTISQKRDWFQLKGLCELNSGNIDLSELIQSLGSDMVNVGGYVRIGDHGWAKISDELKDQLQKLADSVNVERGQMKFDRTAAIAMRNLGECVQVDASKAWQQCLERLAVAESLEPEIPKSLNAELRDYQADGFKWLRRLSEWGVGGVLADDMGLGKTVQTLAVLVDRAQLGPSLVIAPTSVGFNWLREIQRFAPQLSVHSYRDTDRNEFFQELGPGHIVVCSYGLALRDADKLGKVAWSNLVLDEAQAIKNSQSKTSQAIAGIEADWKVALTGTPVENHLGELWSLFRIISPGLLGGWEQFRRRFATPIEKNKDESRRVALREHLKPFILRRTKREVLKDLPARTEQNLVVELSPQERKVYDQYRLSILDQANQISKLPDIKDQRFKLLALLTRLRQIACHVRLVDDSWTERSTKLESLLETLQELRDEGHRTLIFSQFVQHLHLIRAMLDEEKITYQYLDGSTTAQQRQEQVDKFQSGDATAFLISLKAGGTGLNLTAADYVIHMDPWWNPAVEDQATDRAHRIGQTKPVMVYRLIAKNTVEEEILKLHEDKRDLVAGILAGTHEASSLSTQELLALLTR